MSRRGPRSAAAWLLAVLALASAPAAAHPLGNFSISHYAGIVHRGRRVRIRYMIDLAEIPTFQEIQDTGLVPEPCHPTVAPWRARTAEMLRRGLRLTIGDHPLALTAGVTESSSPGRGRAADAEARRRLPGAVPSPTRRDPSSSATRTGTFRIGSAGRRSSSAPGPASPS